MSTLGSSQFDFCCFAAGMFCLLAALHLWLVKREGTTLVGYAYLLSHLILQGTFHWLQLLATDVHDGLGFLRLRDTLLCGSFCALLGFGVVNLKSPWATWRGAVAFAATLLTPAVVIYWHDLTSVATGLGLLTSVLSVTAWISASRGRCSMAGLPRFLIPIGLFLQGTAAWLGELLSVGFGIENVLGNGRENWPTEALWLIAAFCLMVGLERWLKQQTVVHSPQHRRPSLYGWRASVGMVGVFVAGWWASNWCGRNVREMVADDNYDEAQLLVAILEKHVSVVSQSIKVLNGSPLLYPVLLDDNAETLKKAQEILERYARGYPHTTAYLMNRSGTVVAASNSEHSNGFVGQNFAFRPYFQEALAGQPAQYLALGAVSGQRGFYASHPVCHPQSREVLGVVVIKRLLNEELTEFQRRPLAFLVDPHGVILMTGMPGGALRTLWPISDDTRADLLKSRQFGAQLGETVLPGQPRVDSEVFFQGQPCCFYRHLLGDQGWSVVTLQPLTLVAASRLATMIVTITLLIIVMGFTLNNWHAVTINIALTQEVTERTRAEDRLREYSHALEISNRDLERSRTEAEAAARTKAEFLANMSHEIRTPMTAILGYSDLLRTGDVSEQQSEYLAAIYRNGEHLLAIINDILDLSKIDADKMRVESVACDLSLLLADVCHMMRERAIAKELALHWECQGRLPSQVATDPTRLRQILLNLVGNAVKFTERGQVQLVARIEPLGAHRAMLHCAVSDTGIGLTAEQIANLFQAFQQAESCTTRRFGGTGLGLAISQRLAQLLGGQIDVQSVPGQGSTFTVSIELTIPAGTSWVQPVAIRSTTPPVASSSGAALQSTFSRPFRVLLVEDGLDNQRLVSFLLKKAGAEVMVANDGLSGLKQILNAELNTVVNEFDVVLMDMQMPVLDGYQAARQLRTVGYTRPIVALTAHAMFGEKEKCLAAGCNDYQTKPLNRQQLIAVIEHWAGRSEVELQAGISPA